HRQALRGCSTTPPPALPCKGEGEQKGTAWSCSPCPLRGGGRGQGFGIGDSRLFLRRGDFRMIPRRLSLAAWCLAGLLFSSGLALALLLTLTVVGCGGKGEEQGSGLPEDEDEDEPAGPPFFKDVTKASGVKWSCRNGEEFGH